MAVAFDEIEDEEQQAGGEPQQLGAESSVVAGGQPTQRQSDTGSGQYVNLQNYINQNKGQGAEVAGKVKDAITGAESAQNVAETGFKSKADAGSLVGDDALVDRAASDPLAVQRNQDEATKFKKIRDARYTGPTQLVEDAEDYVGAQKATNKAQTFGNLTQDEVGRGELVGEFYGRPGYTKGEKKLDQLLVQNDPNSGESFKELKPLADKTTERFSGLKDSLNKYATDKRTETERASKYAKDKIFGAETNKRTGIKNQYDQVMANRGGLLGDIQSNFAQGRLAAPVQQKYNIKDRLAALGVMEGNQANTYGVDINNPQYFSKAADPTLAQTVTPQQKAEYDALVDLAGINNTFLPDSQVGGYDPNKDFEFQSDRYINDIAGQKGAYEELMNRQAFGRTNSNDSGDARFSGEAVLRDPNDPFLSAGDNYAMTEGSLQDQIAYKQKWDPFYSTPGMANAGTYQHKTQNLQKVLDKINQHYKTRKLNF